MRLRTLALALALGCGLTGMVEARQKPAVYHPVAKKARKTKTPKRNSKASRVKPRKSKLPKAKVAKAKHAKSHHTII